MPPVLVGLKNVSVKFDAVPLFEGADLVVHEGERICILGRNGSGKSTFLKIINGDLMPDTGDISVAKGVRTALLPQSVPEGMAGTVEMIVRQGLDNTVKDDGTEAERLVATVLSKLKLNGADRFETLSGGVKRRTLLARALAGNPDLLLLDEPTNHLDIESISWLEEFILRNVKSLVFVTHDRMFLSKLATRITEFELGRFINWPCNYESFLVRKEASLESNERRQNVFDKKLANEETWIRQGVKARRTRNEGRVKALMRLREEYRARRERMGNVKLELDSSASGKLVFEGSGIDFSFGDGKPVIKGFSTVIQRGDKIGILGPNGIGKTTLLRVILGELEPSSGTRKKGTGLEPTYFDQLRESLDLSKTIRDNVSEGRDEIVINGKPKHIISYLKDFLFTADRLSAPVSFLSGGERNRLLLAKLFTKKTNLLIMDEPTNDLDIETLELLENLLVDYSGTLIVVSHDRAFMNNVVTSTLVFEGEGRVVQYAGGYDDWLSQRKEQTIEKEPAEKKKPRPAQKPSSSSKLSYREKKELEELPSRIEKLEAEQAALHSSMAEPEFYASGEKVKNAKKRLDEIEAGLESCYLRWEQLEAMKD